ncbi:hypothetical protein PHLCEN_2v6048 [Hermanssonia centrifuga]|uniref:DWNN-domain-containing protein n=1 Tax=Hermanssonia centrifuga TaxID=98765 RepID=A0A2R6P0P9_9APHY|nr:hypothetical protein PHLCEN_2v6048 [Hermanssonia centrifuga]
MASSVFYKFKSSRNESKVAFDGTGISVFELKKAIILENNLGKANDFDLAIYDGSSNEEYKDDSYTIPRSSTVVVKRVFAKPGKGKAAMYIGTPSSATQDGSKTGAGTPNGSYSWHRGNISKRFDGKEEPTTSSIPKPTSTSTSTVPEVKMSNNIAKDDELKAMAAMFQQQTANWEETQEKMSHAQRIYSNPRGGGPSRGGKPFGSHHHSDRPLPPSYVCYRCGQKGHWIQDCPTNNDRDYDNRPRIKRTTGIPRSFLKAVENPTTGNLGHGVMVTPEGGYVVAQPDSASWQKQVSKPKGLSEADIRERKPSDPSLVCPIDNVLFRDAVKTPCCGTLYCEECIQTYLLERDFICPSCGAKIQSLDKLIVAKPMRTKVGDYIDKEIEKSRHEAEEESRTSSATPAPNDDKAPLSSDLTQEQEYYGDMQPGNDYDYSQYVTDSIPHLQAQISQISVMLNNPSLPPQVRQQTEMKHQQLQIELERAQLTAAIIHVNTQASAGMMQYGNMQQPYTGQMPQQGWTNPFTNQQPAGQDSAYQRLPLNNRRRNLKRERPSDFLEIAGNDEQKVPRYWE